MSTTKENRRQHFICQFDGAIFAQPLFLGLFITSHSVSVFLSFSFCIIWKKVKLILGEALSIEHNPSYF